MEDCNNISNEFNKFSASIGEICDNNIMPSNKFYALHGIKAAKWILLRLTPIDVPKMFSDPEPKIKQWIWQPIKYILKKESLKENYDM